MSRYLTRQTYIDYIKLMLDADILTLEVSDETIGRYIDFSLMELNTYYDQTKLVTVPFSSCIDLGPYEDEKGEKHEGFKHNAITRIFRTEGFTGDTTVGITSSQIDPLYAQTWSAFSTGGTMFNLQNYVMNYASYNTLLQIRNTLSTDLAFREDKEADKLYINSSYDHPTNITIEYIPVLEDVKQINSEYWQEQLRRLALANVKIGIGRARTRFKQGNALYTDDGDRILEEGTTEKKELEERLRVNKSMLLPID